MMKVQRVFVLSAVLLAVGQAAYAEEDAQVAPAAPTADAQAVTAVNEAGALQAATPESGAAKTDSPQMLRDAVISASNISQSSVAAPANVSVFSAEKLETTNSPRLGDALLAKVPGLFVGGGALGSGRPGTTAARSFRGQYNGVAVLVDGMNMADAYSGAINWSMVLMDEVDRIEVVPGAGSSLYGTGATAGVINIMTKAPTKKEVVFKESFGFGDSAGQYTGAQYRNKFENGLAVGFGVSQNTYDGYAFEYVTKTPTAGTAPAGAVTVNGAIPTTTTKGVPTYIVGEKGKNGYKQQNINSKFYFDLTPSSKINAGFSYTENNSIFTNGKSYLTDATTGKEIPLSNVASTKVIIDGKNTTVTENNFYSGLPSGNNSLRIFAGYEGEVLGDGKLNLNVGSIQRQNWSTAASAAATLMTGVGTLTMSPKSDTTNVTAQLTRPLGNSQLLVAGVSTELADFAQRKYFVANWTNMDSARTLINQLDAKSTNNSVFVQDQVAAGDALTIYVSGRYDTWRASGVAYTPAVAASPAVPGTTTNPAIAAVLASPEQTINFSERTASAFSPKLSAVYKLSDSFSLKSSLGTAFNAPRNYDLFANPAWTGASMSLPNPDLQPEKARSFDIGTEYASSQGGNVKVSGYITKTTDLIYTATTPVTPYFDPISNQTITQTAQKFNTGSALARGIELAGEYPVWNWLAISASYSYTDSRVTADSRTPAIVGKRVIYVPKNMASVALDAQQGHWSGVLSARYVGEQFSNADNSDVVKGVWGGYSKYAVANMKVVCRLAPNLKASLVVDNLTNRVYYEYYRMPGRGVTLELAGNF